MALSVPQYWKKFFRDLLGNKHPLIYGADELQMEGAGIAVYLQAVARRFLIHTFAKPTNDKAIHKLQEIYIMNGPLPGNPKKAATLFSKSLKKYARRYLKEPLSTLADLYKQRIELVIKINGTNKKNKITEVKRQFLKLNRKIESTENIIHLHVFNDTPLWPAHLNNKAKKLLLKMALAKAQNNNIELFSIIDAVPDSHHQYRKLLEIYPDLPTPTFKHLIGARIFNIFAWPDFLLGICKETPQRLLDITPGGDSIVGKAIKCSIILPLAFLQFISTYTLSKVSDAAISHYAGPTKRFVPVKNLEKENMSSIAFSEIELNAPPKRRRKSKTQAKPLPEKTEKELHVHIDETVVIHLPPPEILSPKSDSTEIKPVIEVAPTSNKPEPLATSTTASMLMTLTNATSELQPQKSLKKSDNLPIEIDNPNLELSASTPEVTVNPPKPIIKNDSQLSVAPTSVPPLLIPELLTRPRAPSIPTMEDVIKNIWKTPRSNRSAKTDSPKSSPRYSAHSFPGQST